jgi:DNA-binding transcriptional ArsR family regulator
MTDELNPEPWARMSNRITDPKALRALAHPIRLSLLRLLRTEGPLTATRAAELLGENSATTSFHLRQLAKYGLAQEAGGGQGRQRPWQATAMLTDVPVIADSPELEAAAGLFRSIIADRYFETTTAWLENKANEPQEWQEAAVFGDLMLYLTAAELKTLSDEIYELMAVYLDRLTQPQLRPPDARLVQYIQLAFPPDSSWPGTTRGNDA